MNRAGSWRGSLRRPSRGKPSAGSSGGRAAPIGSSTLTFAMFASLACPVVALGPWFTDMFTFKEAPLPLKLSLASVLAENLG